MYIKNRRNSGKIKAFGSYITLLNRKFNASKSSTFHILTVSGNYNRRPQTQRMTTKNFKIKADEFVDLVPQMGGCFATDKITVDGLRVGYMS
jgi:hypothetical protein